MIKLWQGVAMRTDRDSQAGSIPACHIALSNVHQIGRRKTAAQCSLNHLNVVFQFMLGYYFFEVIEMMKTNLSGIKDASTINDFIYGLDAKNLITYLDCLLDYVQNDPSLMQMGLTRVSLVQPYNVWGILATNQVVLGLTSQKAIHGFEEISFLNMQAQSISQAHELLGIHMGLYRGYSPQFFVQIPVNLISKYSKQLTSITVTPTESKLAKFKELVNDAKDLKANLEHNSTNIIKYFERKNNMMIIDPKFKARNMVVNKNKIFYILPFREEPLNAMKAIVDKVGNDVSIIKSEDMFDPNRGNNIVENIWQDICTSAFAIADLSYKNPNVFYELGICHTIGKKVITVCNRESFKKDYGEHLPADISSEYTEFYDNGYQGNSELANKVSSKVRALLAIRA